jgi:hypothetical protein
MKPVIFSTAADKELDKALAASRSPTKFQLVVDDAIVEIGGNPQVAARVGRTPARQYILTQRLPYSIIYVEKPTAINVVAFAHHSRRPGYWKHRLRKP